MPTYKCPACEDRVSTDRPVKPGQHVDCPSCGEVWAPRAETLAFAEGDHPAKPARKKPVKKAAPSPVATSNPVDDDQEDDSPYGLVEETEEEKKLAERNKPKIGTIRDKFKRSARGPATALLVLPSNLLLAQGALTIIFGIGMVIVGAWPLIFTDAPAAQEEWADQMQLILGGIYCVLWGSIVCYGASQMQNLDSYSWGIVAGVFGLLPLLAGIFTLITLRDPRVIAGFKEPESGATQEEEKEDDFDDEDEDEDDEDVDEYYDDDEEEEDDYDRPRKRRR